MATVYNIPDELVSKTISFDYKTPITKVIPALSKYSAVIVNKNKKYHGIIDRRSVYRTATLKLAKTEDLKRFSINAPKISENTSIDDIISYFYKARVRALPFSEGQKIVGVFERHTFLKMLLSLGLLKDMKVNEAMTTPVLAIDENASLAQAHAAMRSNKVNRLVVMDNNRVAGLVTHYDITQKYTRVTDERMPWWRDKKYTPSNLPVRDIMETNPSSIEYNKAVSDAVRQFVERKISSTIVLKSSKPVGILTVMDVLESLIASRRIEEKRVYISGFDQYTYSYEDEIMEQLKAFINNVEKFKNIKIDYVTLRMKKIKNKSYELQARISLNRGGIISMHSVKYSFQEAFRDLLQKLDKSIRREKEKMLTVRKVNLYREAET